MGNEDYNVYVRSPDGNQVVAIEHGQFVRVDFDNADEMEITVPKRMINGISMLNQGWEIAIHNYIHVVHQQSPLVPELKL